jgi:hypothetical protein
MVKQILMGGCNTVSASATRYMSFWGQNSGASVERAIPIPAGCTIRNLRTELTVAPGGATARTFTVRKNGVATALVNAHGAADTVVTDTDSFTATTGDYISLQSTVTGSPAATNGFFSLEIEWDDATKACLFGSSTPNSAATRYVGVAGTGSTSGTTENQFQAAAVLAGTLESFYAHVSGSPGSAGGGYDYQLRINGANSGSAIALRNTTTDASVTGLATAFVVGDLFAIDAIRTATANAVEIGTALFYTPAVTGESMVIGFTSGLASDDTYNGVNSAGTAWGAIGTVRVVSGPTGWTLRKLRAKVVSAPGAGTSRIYKVFGNGSALTNVATISDANTAAADSSNTDAITAGMLLDIQHTVAGSPGASSAQTWGFVQWDGTGGGGGSSNQHLLLLGVG